MNQTFSKSHWSVFLILFIASFFFQILSKSILWDDWLIHNHTPENVMDFVRHTGFFGYWQAYIYNWLNSLSYGISLNRIINFVLYLGSAWCLERILRFVKEIDLTERFFLVLVFAIAPLSFIRILGNDIHYVICYFCFYLALLFLCKYELQKNIIFRFAAALLFFFSFSMNGFLVLYAVSFIMLFYLKKHKTLIQRVKELFLYFDFILLPIVFWFIKTNYYKPLGYFSTNYNKITLSGLIDGFILFPLVIKNSFLLTIFRYSLGGLSALDWVVFLLVGYYLFRRFRFSIEISRQKTLFMFLLGLFFFFLGSYSYTVVGKVSNFEDIPHTGYQVLLPLGFSFMVFSGICFARVVLKNNILINFNVGRWKINSDDILMAFVGVLILSFVKFNIDTYTALNIDWYKHKAMALKMTEYAEFQVNKSIVIDDTTRSLNALERHTDFYEITGAMKKFLGDESRFAFVCYHSDSDWLNWPFDPRYFNWFSMTNYQKTEFPDLHVKFSINSNLRTDFLKLFYLEWFDEKELDKYLMKVSEYKIRKFQGADDFKCSL